MIAALLACALLAAAPQEPPVSGDCSADPAALVAEAEALLSASGSEPPGETLGYARRLLRTARRADASLALAIRAADLAFAAGDLEEGADLLALVAETDPRRLSPAELLLLGRRAEDRHRWREAISRYENLGQALRARSEAGGWIGPRVRELELEEQAGSIALPASGPSVEARLALAEGKRALAAGRLREARESLRTALQLSPDYVEALLALAALETRAGRPAAAIRACRQALAAEPERVETLTQLANLLWEEPDRAAKQESLVLLDRAAGLRPDLRPLLRLSAGRWADYGDAPRAQDRLDRYLAGATAQERAQAQALRDTLARRIQGVAEPTPGAVAAPPPEEPASDAADRWRKAQVYAARGDDASVTEALALLADAERLDPSFARAPELGATIHERRGDWKEAEEASRRAIRADPTRVTSRETLARVLDRNPARAAEAAEAWSQAEQAGSTEALFHLAQSAESAGETAGALRLYARYRDEAPEGLHAADAAASAARLDRRRTGWIAGAASLVALALCVAAFTFYRLRTGSTFAEWLTRDPAMAPQARRIVGRLRHEVLKHGGMLLSDAADRLESADAEIRRAAARLLDVRLYGDANGRGLVAEAKTSTAALQDLARADGHRLNLAHRDPLFSFLLRGIGSLGRLRGSVRRLAHAAEPSRPRVRRAARLLRRAARSFQLASGSEIERSIDRAAALPIRLDALEALLARIAIEQNGTAPPLELSEAESLPPVSIAAADWETLWRNLFSNVLAARSLAISAALRRDPITGEGRLRIVLADDLAGRLTTGDIRGRSPDRGLGVVADILRRNDGSIEVIAAPASRFTKGVAIELPIVEGPA